MSTNNDGMCLEHFTDGDYIRVVRADDQASTEVTGIVVGTPDAAAGTAVIALDATWTPGSDVWVLEFQKDTTGSLASAAQRQFAYVADENLKLADDSFARRLQ